MNNQIRTVIHAAILVIPDVVPYLTDAALKASFIAYQPLRDDYWARIYDAVDGYLTGDKPITRYRNSTVNLVRDYFQQAAELGYQDAGAALPLDDATQSLVDSSISAEAVHIADLFVGLRDRGIADYSAEAYARADGYSAGLDTVYNLGKTLAAGNKMLTWQLGKTEVHCNTCSMLDGQRHRASWFLDKGYIPRQPGSETLDCKGYNCDCSLVDDDGDIWTR